MEIWFHPAKALAALTKKAAETAGFGSGFDPMIRPADPKFGDFQANGAPAIRQGPQGKPEGRGRKNCSRR